MTRQEEDDTIYDEVTENQYKSIVKGRLQRDDFVVDDGAEGYVDDGMDDWTGGNKSEDEEDFGKGKGITRKTRILRGYIQHSPSEKESCHREIQGKA